MPHSQRPRGLVLYEHVAAAVSIPVGEVDANAGAGNLEVDGDVVAPFRRLVDVESTVDRGVLEMLIDARLSGACPRGYSRLRNGLGWDQEGECRSPLAIRRRRGRGRGERSIR